jgi:hypothetical protein
MTEFKETSEEKGTEYNWVQGLEEVNMEMEPDFKPGSIHGEEQQIFWKNID